MLRIKNLRSVPASRAMDTSDCTPKSSSAKGMNRQRTPAPSSSLTSTNDPSPCHPPTPRPEVLRAKRAKGQPGQSDVPIRLRANEQRSVRGLCSLCTLCSQPFSSRTSTRRDFARLLADDLAELMPTFVRLLARSSASRMAMVADLLKPSRSPDGPPYGFSIARATVVAKRKTEQLWSNRWVAGRWPGRCSGYGWLLFIMQGTLNGKHFDEPH